MSEFFYESLVCFVLELLLELKAVDCVLCALDIAKALSHMHKNDIIHGGIRASSIFLLPDEAIEQAAVLCSLEKACSVDSVLLGL